MSTTPFSSAIIQNLDLNLFFPKELATRFKNKVKLHCSYGGMFVVLDKDGIVRYSNGQTRIISIEREAKFWEVLRKMEEFFGGPVLLKYKLPDGDLDCLVTVSCLEDFENMWDEYDRVMPDKLRVFLFKPDFEHVDRFFDQVLRQR